MKKPDRFERAVQNVKAVICIAGGRAIYTRDAIKLLRRQHAAVVRLVKRKKEAAKLRPMGFARTDGYFMACDDLLAILAAWRRGTKCR